MIIFGRRQQRIKTHCQSKYTETSKYIFESVKSPENDVEIEEDEADKALFPQPHHHRHHSPTHFRSNPNCPNPRCKALFPTFQSVQPVKVHRFNLGTPEKRKRNFFFPSRCSQIGVPNLGLKEKKIESRSFFHLGFGVFCLCLMRIGVGDEGCPNQKWWILSRVCVSSFYSTFAWTQMWKWLVTGIAHRRVLYSHCPN